MGYDESHMPNSFPRKLSVLFDGTKGWSPQTPVWAEKITGVPAGVIENLAIEYAVTKPACLMPGVRSPKNHERRTDLPSAGGFSVYDWKCRGLGRRERRLCLSEKPYGSRIPRF